MNGLERDFEEIVMFFIDICEIKCIHSEIVLILMILGRYEQ